MKGNKMRDLRCIFKVKVEFKSKLDKTNVSSVFEKIGMFKVSAKTAHSFTL